jgi:two-component system sensor histidine kinase KdpD
MGNEEIRASKSGEAARPRLFEEEAPPFQYYAAFLIVGFVTAANLALASYAGYWSAAIIYLAAISLSAAWLGPGPVIFGAVISAAAWDFLFIPPRFAFTISRTEDVLMLGLYLLVSLSSGLATTRLRASERMLRDRGEQLSAVNALAISLAGAGSASEILALGLDTIRRAAGGCETIVILAEGGALRNRAEDGWEPLDAEAREAARRCFESRAPAGRFSDVLPGSEWRFMPLAASNRDLGVIGLRPEREAARSEIELSRLSALAAIVGLALSREPGPPSPGGAVLTHP